MNRDEMCGSGELERFMGLMEKACGQAKESGGVVSLAILDIDEFAAINADLGEDTGDEVLTVVSDSLRENLEEDAVVCRMGSDEFGVLLEGVEPEDAFLAMDCLRRLLEKSGGEEKDFTVSIGLASFPKDGKSPAEVLRNADAGLFRAKRLGRNRVCLTPEVKLVTKTSHYTETQLERLNRLAKNQSVGTSHLLREALDDLLFKYRRMS